LRNVGIKGARGHRLIPRPGDSPTLPGTPTSGAARNTTSATRLAAAPPTNA
jgi:hypothetical protein